MKKFGALVLITLVIGFSSIAFADGNNAIDKAREQKVLEYFQGIYASTTEILFADFSNKDPEVEKPRFENMGKYKEQFVEMHTISAQEWVRTHINPGGGAKVAVTKVWLLYPFFIESDEPSPYWKVGEALQGAARVLVETVVLSASDKLLARHKAVYDVLFGVADEDGGAYKIRGFILRKEIREVGK